jgi:hypothetical protein
LARRKQRISKEVSSDLVKEARAREGDERWLGSAPALVLRRYYGKYVAVKNRKILASSFNMKGLYQKLDKLNPGMVLITRIEKPLRPGDFAGAWNVTDPEMREISKSFRRIWSGSPRLSDVAGSKTISREDWQRARKVLQKAGATTTSLK